MGITTKRSRSSCQLGANNQSSFTMSSIVRLTSEQHSFVKNCDPDRWRDIQNAEHVLGKYIISDHPMTAEQWAAERATVINDVVEEMNNDLPGLSPPSPQDFPESPRSDGKPSKT